jgi:hypothetical protein
MGGQRNGFANLLRNVAVINKRPRCEQPPYKSRATYGSLLLQSPNTLLITASSGSPFVRSSSLTFSTNSFLSLPTTPIYRLSRPSKLPTFYFTMKYRYVALAAAAATGASAQELSSAYTSSSVAETQSAYTSSSVEESPSGYTSSSVVETQSSYITSSGSSTASSVPSNPPSSVPTVSSDVPVIPATSQTISSMTNLPTVSSSSATHSYTTVTIDECPKESPETMITVTNGVTVTYCPTCEHDSTTAGPKPTDPAHTTVYTTVYSSLCSTGLVPVTYTITEECSDAIPTWASASDHVPDGFTVTTKDCHVCDEKTAVPVTITEPCTDGCGKPAPPPATGAPVPSGKPAPSGNPPVEQIPDGQVQAPGPSGGAVRPPADTGCPDGVDCPAGGDMPAPAGDDSKCPGGPNCPKPTPGASASNGGAGPYPTPSGKCPGPGCEAKPTRNSTKPGTEGPEEYTGGANTFSLGFVSSLGMATVVAALAFFL